MIWPRTLYVSGNVVEDWNDEPWEEVEKDPRGLVLMWEPPDKKAKYVMGMDPTHGITGWSRGTRSDNDHKIDNGAIEIFKIDGTHRLLYKDQEDDDGQMVKVPDIDQATGRQRRLYRDVQVCEFAAPCDAVELAGVANVLGRIYAGGDEDQCELIWEAWPGPGILTTQELLRLGYGNLWQWEYIDSVAETTNRLGWRSTRESQKMLWYRSRRHIMRDQALIQSSFLKNEYANAEIDLDKMRAAAAYGYHDDRFQAANMVFWAGHKWTYEVERTDERVTEVPNQDYQRMAHVLDDHETFGEWKARFTEDWE